MRAKHGGCELIVAGELIFEILVRLPVKSVGRFRCVCRRWSSISLDPAFIWAHASRATVSGFFLEQIDRSRGHTWHLHHVPLDDASELTRLPDPSLSFLDDFDYSINPRYPPFIPVSYPRLRSLNGFILCDGYWKGEGAADREPALCICNPITKQFRVVSLPKDGGLPKNYAFAFVAPPISSEFKLIGWDDDGGLSGQTCLKIYSSATQSWKVLNIPYCGGRAVSWNGRLVFPDCGVCDSFLVMNVEDETLSKVPQPRSICSHLGQSRGCLHFVGSDADGKGDSWLHYDILVMDSECTGWSLLYHIDLSSIKSLLEQAVFLRWGFKCFLPGDSRNSDQLFLQLPDNRQIDRVKLISFLPQSNTYTTIFEGRLDYSAAHMHSLLSL